MQSAISLYQTIDSLSSPDEAERIQAAYQLGVIRDRRALAPLIAVLRDTTAPPVLRGYAAESLKCIGKRKAIPAMVECSRDTSPEVRFWCVFALGSFVDPRKTPLPVVRALEARLDDAGVPESRGMWRVGLEALVMLQRCHASRLPLRDMFGATMIRALRAPLRDRGEWRWAFHYWSESIAATPEESRGLLDDAVRQIHEAGFDPACFGTESPGSIPKGPLPDQ